MAELIISRDEVLGIKKEIDSGAMPLILQALQEDMYSYPIRSFVREAISNGLDAITERDIAKDILSGAPVDKYYRQEQDGQLLKDSEFNRDYYDTSYISSRTYVNVFYELGTDRDTMHIEDKGVGLSGSRLKGFMSLGFSTKRNMKDVFGKFGTGAKAGLSTGVEYFIMKTTFNGYSTEFMIFKHDYDPITIKNEPGFNEIWKVTMADGTVRDKIIYWKKSDEANGVKISLPVKKHNRDAFITAVRQQFSYFKGKVRLKAPFKYVEGYNLEYLNNTPLYESDSIIIPDTSPYTVPHIIVDGLNYGAVNWPELELEDREGLVGLKVSANEVDITQNRENLKWTDRTKKVILSRLTSARSEASTYITSLVTSVIDDTNFFLKLKAYLQTSKSSNNEVAIAFSKFLDMSSIVPVVAIKGLIKSGGYISISLNEKYFKRMFYNFTLVNIIVDNSGKNISIHRETISSFSEISDDIVYADLASLGDKKTMHLINKFKTNGFTYIRYRNRDLYPVIDGHLDSEGLVKKYIHKNINGHATLLDDMEFDYSEEESANESIIKSTEATAADIRKRNRQTLYMTYDQTFYDGYKRYSGYVKEYQSERDKFTIKISDIINDLSSDTIVCTQEHADLGKIVEIVNSISGKHHEVIYVAKDAVKHFLPTCTYITDYIKSYDTKTKKIMVGEAFKDLNTIRKLTELREEYSEFVNNSTLLKSLVSFDVDRFLKITGLPVESLKETLNLAYINKDVIDNVLGYLTKLGEVQDIIKTESNETIAQKSKELLGAEILYVNAYDEAFYTEVKIELDRIKILAPILNTVSSSSLGDKEEFTNLVNKIIPLIN